MNYSRDLSATLAALAMLLTAAMVGPANAQDEEEERVFSGTVEINTTQMGFIITGRAGGGVLEYEGHEYYFDIAGLGIGGIGVTHLNVVGAVYNLDELSKFSGTYVQVRAGGAITSKGKGYLSLGNGKGVHMDLKGSQKGLGMMTGIDGIVITLK